jgi:hypothetical protein
MILNLLKHLREKYPEYTKIMPNPKDFKTMIEASNSKFNSKKLVKPLKKYFKKKKKNLLK